MVSRNEEILPLAGIRGLAACAVLASHAVTASMKGTELTAHYFPGQPFVDLFFTLSGFVIAYVYLARGRIDWKAFAIARFARVYPLHLATALFMGAAAAAVFLAKGKPLPDWISLTQLLREITLTTAMPVVGGLKIWNFPSWSISVEWWTYFISFPIIVALLRVLPFRAFAALVAALLVGLVVWLYVMPAGTMPTRGWTAFIRASLGFAAGVAVYMAWDVNGRPMVSGWKADLLFVVTLTYIYLERPLFGNQPWLTILLFPPLIYCLASSPTGSYANAMLSSRPFVFLGEISYSIYLIHSVALNIIEETIGRFTWFEGAAIWVLATAALTFALSCLSYYFLELPAKISIRKAFTRRNPRARPAE